MKHCLVLSSVAGLVLCSGACERHQWQETKALHEQHGSHGAAAGGEHGAAADQHGGAGGQHETNPAEEGKPAH